MLNDVFVTNRITMPFGILFKESIGYIQPWYHRVDSLKTHARKMYILISHLYGFTKGMLQV